ncbi:MAG: hypothetical protein JWO70_5250 [Betaproteobacteria bacterium]|nr:hypothetical protein [Betaproteobacteria bacterium]
MITVAFVHVGNDALLPRIMVASVRRAMPHAQVVHLTDESTPAIADVDEVVRLRYDGVHLMPYRLEHFARLEPCDAIFLDTDIIVQKDLGALFETPFDIALTRREAIGTDPAGVDVAQVMPYNTGVMLSTRGGWDFWRNAWRVCESYTEEARRWWGDQYAVKALAEAAPIRILELACDAYNYSPATQSEDVSGRHVVHYKGTERKAWMKRRGELELGICG